MQKFWKEFNNFISENFYSIWGLFEVLLGCASLILSILVQDELVRHSFLVLFVMYFLSSRLSQVMAKLDKMYSLLLIILDHNPQLFAALFKDIKFQVISSREEVVKEIKASRKK